jgi:hypothetical protein
MLTARTVSLLVCSKYVNIVALSAAQCDQKKIGQRRVKMTTSIVTETLTPAKDKNELFKWVQDKPGITSSIFHLAYSTNFKAVAEYIYMHSDQSHRISQQNQLFMKN